MLNVGKTTLAVYTAVKNYRSRLRKTKIINFFRKLFHLPLIELPRLYSNIPLKVPGIDYVQVTKKLLTREERFVYGSVVLLSEFSLIADSQAIRDQKLNEQILLFAKLFRS